MNSLDKNVEILDETVISNSSLLLNIFYPNTERIVNKLNDEITKNNLYKEFKKVYMVCLNDNTDFKSFFNDKYITEDQFAYIKSTIKIIQISYNSLTDIMFHYLTIMDVLIFNEFQVKDKYNSICIESDDVLLCCLFQFKYIDICRYLKQFEGITNFIDLYNGLLISEYLNMKSNDKIINSQIQIIQNIEESNYWTNKINCKLNYDIKFKENNFNLSLFDKLKNNKTFNIIKYIESLKDNSNYLEFLFKKHNYVDASSSIDEKGFKLYYIPNSQIINTITNINFNMFFDKLNDECKYYLIMNCLISKELCHLIVNNKYILQYIMASYDIKYNRTFMELYGQILRYCLGYSWVIMYMEESIKRSYITTKDRFIFDIETASLLPWFPYSIENISICPYLPILVSKDLLNISKNILGIEQHIYLNKENYEITRYGVAKKEVFINRLNKFISGKNDLNLLENLNWENVAISGSIMACCVPNYNTLMSKFVINKDNFEIDFIGFVNHFYKTADIDVMCNINDIYLFVDKINEFNNTLNTNIKTIYNINSEIELTKIFTNKTVSILINSNYINKYILSKTKLPYDTIIKDINNIEIKKIIYDEFITWFMSYLNKNALINFDNFINIKYSELFTLIPIEELNTIFINSLSEDYLFEPKINYKFRISSYYLPHNFEFFQIKYDNFFSTVSQFHLPIVRSYYDGNNVYLTPSCISACMTLINIDYKYFAGKRNPIEIINKYRHRGFGIILNQTEIKKFLEYSNICDTWKKLYNLNIKSNRSILNTVGLLTINHNFYNTQSIGNYCNIIYNTDYNIVSLSHNETVQTINKLYNINSNELDNKLITINKFGFINIIKKWIINAYNDFNL